MRALLLVPLIAACFEPHYTEGLACATDGTCPPGQHCWNVGGESQCFAVAPTPDGSTGGACDLVSQTGCAADQKCTVDSDGTRMCYPNGTLARWEPCGGLGTDDLCQRGDVCIYGVCRPVCSVNPDPDMTMPHCTNKTCEGVSLSQQNFGVTVCVDRCDPFDQSSCPPAGTLTLACYINSNLETVCLPPDENPLPEGAACTATTQCIAGTNCDHQYCRKYCNWQQAPNQQGPCNAGQTCHFVIDPVGVCR